MLDKTFFGGIKKVFTARDTERRSIMKESSEVLHRAKQSIFALHREDVAGAGALLREAVDMLKGIEKRVKKFPELSDEGSLRAAEEELVEAHIFYQLVHGKRAGKIEGLNIPHHVYLAGLCDVPGELVRYAIREATARKFDAVGRSHDMVQDIMTYLIQFNFIGYLRTKYDQAKQMSKRMEEVAYEISGR